MMRSVLLLATLMSIGCASYLDPTIVGSATTSSDKAYLYGKFDYVYRENSLQLGVLIENINTSERTLVRLELPGTEPSSKLIELRAGTYRLSKMVNIGDWVGSEEVDVIDCAHRTPFLVERGAILYIGDLEGFTKSSSVVTGPYMSVETQTGYKLDAREAETIAQELSLKRIDRNGGMLNFAPYLKSNFKTGCHSEEDKT